MIVDKKTDLNIYKERSKDADICCDAPVPAKVPQVAEFSYCAPVSSCCATSTSNEKGARLYRAWRALSISILIGMLVSIP